MKKHIEEKPIPATRSLREFLESNINVLHSAGEKPRKFKTKGALSDGANSIYYNEPGGTYQT